MCGVMSAAVFTSVAFMALVYVFPTDNCLNIELMIYAGCKTGKYPPKWSEASCADALNTLVSGTGNLYR